MARYNSRMIKLLSRLHRLLAVSLLGLLLAGTPALAANVDLPPVDSVFVLSAKATSRDHIEVRWTIADGYYLYRHRTSVKAAAGFDDGNLTLPAGAKHHDEFFGDVETYRKQLLGSFTGTPLADVSAVKLTVKYQGCADAGVCYPPQTRTLTVALPQAAAGDDGFALSRKSSGALFGFGDGASNNAPLPPEQAFTSDVIALDGNTLLLRLTPAHGYYLYRDKLSAQLHAGPGLSATLPPPAQRPNATPYRDEHFGKVAVYFDQVEIRVPVQRQRREAARGTLQVELQGCQDNGICYPPMTRNLAVSLPACEITSPADAADAAPADSLPPASPNAGAIASPQTEAATDAGVSSASETSANANLDAPAREVPPQQSSPGLLLSLLLALAGGLILNLMPCVLPVLSLKALGLAQSGESHARARKHALLYTAGVLISMLALGGLALALRHAGLALGWGFQLQQPLVLATLALVMFALGLSLSGLWHANVTLGTGTSALLAGNSARADFFTGMLAVVLATPCTAPFMGAALAYAFTGPLLGALLVFLMLGVGLALPFLAIGFVPALATRLPKPGAWMDTFKQLLAFPLYATAAWLVWVLAKLRGADAVGLWLSAALLLALAAWAWSRARAGGMRVWQPVALMALLAIAAPLLKLHALPRLSSTAAPNTNDHVAWSPQALADLRAQGRPVFVNMTADWCVTCKANEKTVFARASFRDALTAANAVYMVGDYTDVDPEITAYLQAHKAVGVPLYVVYPQGGGEGEILPTLLTPGMAADALARAAR